jgi:hypothetical protein
LASPYLPFSAVHAELPLAAWLAPIFVLRFARTQPKAASGLST